MSKGEKRQGHQEKQLKREDVESMVAQGRAVVILFGAVYDLTPFLNDHPGGAEVILSFRGKDATEKFVEVGHLKGARILKTLASLRVGKLAEDPAPKL
jgi:cytochrome b involved in lipid metabolism